MIEERDAYSRVSQDARSENSFLFPRAVMPFGSSRNPFLAVKTFSFTFWFFALYVLQSCILNHLWVEPGTFGALELRMITGINPHEHYQWKQGK